MLKQSAKYFQVELQLVMSLIVVYLFFGCFLNVKAQTDTTHILPEYCKPRLKGVPSGKGVSVDYEYQSKYTLKTKDLTGQYGDTENKIRANTRFKAKLKVPIVYRESITLLVGFRYGFEEYYFGDLSNKNPLFKGLEDKGLRKIGSDILLIKPTRSKNYWILRLRADFNGDYSNDFVHREYLRFSISPAWGKKVSDDFTYALGLSYNYRFGSPLLIPIISINRNLTSKWDFESVLPVFIRLRYKSNKNTNWINSVELDGASYRVNGLDDSFEGFSNIHLHRSDLRVVSRLEKRISGWLWFGADIGFNQNLVYNITNSNVSNGDVLFDNNLSSGIIANISLFLTPNKKQ